MAEILIIDDEKAIRKTLTEILSFEGYKLEEAADGEEGLKKFKEKNYDLVLCDIKMPKLDGIEFLQKAGEINPDIPVVMSVLLQCSRMAKYQRVLTRRMLPIL